MTHSLPVAGASPESIKTTAPATAVAVMGTAASDTSMHPSLNASEHRNQERDSACAFILPLTIAVGVVTIVAIGCTIVITIAVSPPWLHWLLLSLFLSLGLLTLLFLLLLLALDPGVVPPSSIKDPLISRAEAGEVSPDLLRDSAGQWTRARLLARHELYRSSGRRDPDRSRAKVQVRQGTTATGKSRGGDTSGDTSSTAGSNSGGAGGSGAGATNTITPGREAVYGGVEMSGFGRSGDESVIHWPEAGGVAGGVKGDESSGDVEAAREGEGGVEVVEEVVTVRYCGKCNVWRTPRMVHCYRCGHCMERADHHCDALNTCIALNNHRFFLAFLLSFSALAFTLMAAAVLEMLQQFQSSKSWGQQPVPVYALLAILALSSYSIGLFLFASWHCCVLVCDTTTREFINYYRGKAVTSTSNTRSLDTAWASLQEVFCAPVRWRGIRSKDFH